MQRIISAIVTWMIAVSPVCAAISNGKVYWSDYETRCIQRAKLDGTQVETVVTNSGRLAGLAIDGVNGQVYWADNDPFSLPAIGRCNLDGTDFRVLISEPWNSGMQFPQLMALDLARGNFYYTSGNTRSIERANLGGSSRTTILRADLNGPVGIALDQTNQFLYWTHILSTHSRICRSRLDGSGTVELLYQQGFFYGLALDPAAGHMYWADMHPDVHAIRRANLDGSNPVSLVTGVEPFGIALDLQDRKVYWANCRTPSIQRANLDGSEVETIISRDNVPGLGYPMDVAILHLPEPDTTSPEVQCAATPGVLSMPNHRMVEVQISVRAFDEGTPSPQDLFSNLLVTITSNQPDNSSRDGNTTGDVNGADGYSSAVDVSSLFVPDPETGAFVATVGLRAETADNRHGRVYTVKAMVADRAGNVGTCQQEVRVGRKYKPAEADAWLHLIASERLAPAF